MGDILQDPEIREQLHPISIETYHSMGELGLVDAKVELLRGSLVRKMSKSPLHVCLVEFLFEKIAAVLPDHLKCRLEQPLTLSESEPEPDLAVVKKTDDNYRTAHPSSAHLVVEVAISSQKVDAEKATIYAEAEIPEFWLVDGVAKTVEVFDSPKGGMYQNHRILTVTDSLDSQSLQALSISIKELFL